MNSLAASRTLIAAILALGVEQGAGECLKREDATSQVAAETLMNLGGSLVHYAKLPQPKRPPVAEKIEGECTRLLRLIKNHGRA